MNRKLMGLNEEYAWMMSRVVEVQATTFLEASLLSSCLSDECKMLQL
jgi:hypothetical protein